MDSLNVVIMAAGKGKRMGLETPKVLASTYSGPLLHLVLETALSLKPERIIVVVGEDGELIEESLGSCQKFSRLIDQEEIVFATQPEANGTAGAVKAALPFISSFIRTTLVLSGDVALIRSSTVEKMIACHARSRSVVTFLSAFAPFPNQYGRVMRNSDGDVSKIIEFADCSYSELLINEVNAGVWLVETNFLKTAINLIDSDNVQQELYLTDIVEIALREGKNVQALPFSGSEEIRGANIPEELLAISSTLRKRKVEEFNRKGVIFLDPDTVYLDSQISIGRGTTIGPNVSIFGKSTVGKNVVIEGSAYLKDVEIDDGAHLLFGVHAGSAKIGSNAKVGPFCHLRCGAVLGKDVKVGNFVEVKNTTLEEGAKASHLTYLGDAKVGKNANIGAGTITCNYDGYKKSKTTIGDKAFIGSNTSLVAPVTVGSGAIIGAGSVVTKDVSSDSLALTRAEQKEIEGWAAKKRKREKNN